jgi:hypothetical protein
MRLPRWTALLALPLLVGAVLFMHGLDIGASDAAAHGPATSGEPHAHGEHNPAPAGSDDHGCEDCAAHAMAACVAVIVTIAAIRTGLRVRGDQPWSGRVLAGPGPVRAWGELIRPPEPPWVRLAVMQR